MFDCEGKFTAKLCEVFYAGKCSDTTVVSGSPVQLALRVGIFRMLKDEKKEPGCSKGKGYGTVGRG